MDTAPDALVKAAIEQALAIDDPATRARTITRIMKAVDDDKRLNQTREADIRHLRETRRVNEIAELVELSPGRISHIVKGRVTGKRAHRQHREGP